MAEDELPGVVVFVMDTGPLITLAAAASLDYLRYPEVPVYIPDAVFYEATAKFGALGAQDITEWAQANRDLVQIIPTSVFTAGQIAATLPEGAQRTITKDMGERAAAEAAAAALDGQDRAALAVVMTEDAKVLSAAKRFPQEGILTITTRDFLNGLEAAGRINSADAVYERAEDAGRYASRQEAAREAHDRGLDALQRVMAAQERRRRDPGRDR